MWGRNSVFFLPYEINPNSAHPWLGRVNCWGINNVAKRCTTSPSFCILFSCMLLCFLFVTQAFVFLLSRFFEFLWLQSSPAAIFFPSDVPPGCHCLVAGGSEQSRVMMLSCLLRSRRCFLPGGSIVCCLFFYVRCYGSFSCARLWLMCQASRRPASWPACVTDAFHKTFFLASVFFDVRRLTPFCVGPSPYYASIWCVLFLLKWRRPRGGGNK